MLGIVFNFYRLVLYIVALHQLFCIVFHSFTMYLHCSIRYLPAALAPSSKEANRLSRSVDKYDLKMEEKIGKKDTMYEMYLCRYWLKIKVHNNSS